MDWVKINTSTEAINVTETVDYKSQGKKYNIIYADPPWMENKRNNQNTKFGRASQGYYNLMTTDEICKLPIKDITAPNCALFMWVTFPHLLEAEKVMKAWGFKYKTIAFNWFKVNKNNQKPCFGIGYYTKSNTEICLLGIKGKMKPISNYVSSVVIAEEEDGDIIDTATVVSVRQEHSKKPAIVRDKIVELFGDLPRVELFARQTYDGWDSFGDQIGDETISLGG